MVICIDKSQSFRREVERNMAGTGGQLRVPLRFLKILSYHHQLNYKEFESLHCCRK